MLPSDPEPAKLTPEEAAEPVFTPDEVASLNAYQESGVFHPYTCGLCRADLVATSAGWRCPTPGCPYTQAWAHDFTKNWSWQEPLRLLAELGAIELNEDDDGYPD